MSRRRPAEESLLFDLPLDRPPAAEPPPTPGEEEVEQPPLPLVDEPPAAREPEPAADSREAVIPDSHRQGPPGTGGAAASPPAAATLRQRFAAGIADLGVCAAVAVVLLVALLAQGVRPALSDWPAGLLFLLTFSFLYSVLPLAFWGRTPGMALASLRSTARDGRPLSFRQAIASWLGGVLTVALAGLPLLVAPGGRSLSDLLSGSVTRRSVLRR